MTYLTCPASHRDAHPSLSPWRCSPASHQSPRQPATAPWDTSLRETEKDNCNGSFDLIFGAAQSFTTSNVDQLGGNKKPVECTRL